MKAGNESGKETRWGRNDDKHLFEALRTVQLHKGFNLAKIERLKNPSLSGELRELAEIIGWKGTMKRLLRRIKNVSRLKSFSVRETKRLKRILRKEFIGVTINYESLLFEFPGKTVEQIMEQTEKLIKTGHRRKPRFHR